MKAKSNNRLKSLSLLFLISIISTVAVAQDRIFSIGYTKNFVDKDSTNISFTLDLNRVPGKTEAGGTYYLANEPIIGTPFDVYVKPTADVNLGSYTTIAANNIAVGLPIGLAYRFTRNGNSGNLFGSLEFGPDMIADKSFNTYLYYLSSGVILNYSYSSSNNAAFVIDIATGLKYGLGKRMISAKTEDSERYNKYIIPLGLSLSGWKSNSNTFYHLKFSGIYKYNYLIKDSPVFAESKNRNYAQLKCDYFFMSQLGINLTYTEGYEEPLFKRVNSISFGITFARQ